MTITAGGQPGSGSRVDFSDDLDLGTANAFEGGVNLRLGPHELGVRYDPSSFHGDATLDRTIVFHGATYPAGDRVSSDVSIDFIIPEYDYRFWSLNGTDLRGGIRGYIWTFDSELKGFGPWGCTRREPEFHARPPGRLLHAGGLLAQLEDLGDGGRRSHRIGPLRGRLRSRNRILPIRRSRGVEPRLPLASHGISRNDEPWSAHRKWSSSFSFGAILGVNSARPHLSVKPGVRGGVYRACSALRVQIADFGSTAANSGKARMDHIQSQELSGVLSAI